MKSSLNIVLIHLSNPIRHTLQSKWSIKYYLILCFFRERLRCPAPLALKMPPVFTRGWDWTYWPRPLLLPGSLRRSPFSLSLTLCNIHCVFYSISKCFGQIPIFVLLVLRSLIFGTENDDGISM